MRLNGRRLQKQVAILNGKHVITDGEVEFDNDTHMGFVFTKSPLEGVDPSFVNHTSRWVGGRLVVNKAYQYYGTIELVWMEVVE